MEEYDLIVIGSGPAGEKAAVKAAYFLHKVALVEKAELFGGANMRLALPVKVLKETALYFSDKYEKGLYGVSLKPESEIKMEDWMYRTQLLKKKRSESIYNNLIQHKVKIYQGEAEIKDSNTVEISNSSTKETISGKNILIATGVSYDVPQNFPFDGKRIHTVESLFNMKRIPTSICIIGAGPIGCEISCVFNTMGIKVYLINHHQSILPFCDQEIANELLKYMREDGIQTMFGCKTSSIKPPKNDSEMVHISFENNVQPDIEVDVVVLTTSRKGAVQNLGCDKAGIQLDESQLVKVNENYQTNVPNIYAAGDIIGFPGLANVSMDQGRAAVSHMFKIDDMNAYNLTNMPYGVYSIPEISTVGKSEEQAIKEKLNYAVGKVYYSDVARGMIMGAKQGMIKIIFDKSNLTVLGIHIIGFLATELIHYGVEAVQNKLTLNSLVNKNYNFPSLHEVYKYAAFDGLSEMKGYKMKQHVKIE